MSPNTPIAPKSTYTDLLTVANSLCKAVFFFHDNKYPTVELNCPIYLPGDFQRMYGKVLEGIVLLSYVTNGVSYIMVSNIHNSKPMDRLEYMLYKAVSTLKDMEV